MPDGGQLNIETGNEIVTPETSSSLVGLDPGEYVVLRVTDTGTGMDEATQKRMFEPFFTTKDVDKGAGLGLAMVYGIVKSHRALIFCESKPGAGTSFRIYFPRSYVRVRNTASARPPVPGGSERILLVEDEEPLRRQGEAIMGSFGYDVVSEPDAESALRRFADEHESIDLVVLDLIMPGTGGQKCLSRMRKIDPKVKVVITSGLADTKRRTELRAAKAFVAKPYSVGVLLQTIRAVLDEA